MYANFQAKWTTFTFLAQICLKWILGLEFQKSTCGFGISTSKIPCVPIFRQNRQLWIFRPKFWEISHYMWCSCSNNVKGVANNSVDAEMSWVEVCRRYSNTLKFINYTSTATLWQIKGFIVEVDFKNCSIDFIV